MNFGEILEKWEKQNPENVAYIKEKSKDVPVFTKKSERRNRLLKKKCDDSIDLHGLNREEAWTALENFFESSRKKGFEKLLIIHGKGNHYSGSIENFSQNRNMLKEVSRRFIELCSFAGESGYSHAKEGGTGSTWVILKDGN